MKSESNQQVETKAKDKGQEIEQVDFSVFKEQFYTLYGTYKENRKKQIALKNDLEDANSAKSALISELKALVENRKHWFGL